MSSCGKSLSLVGLLLVLALPAGCPLAGRDAELGAALDPVIDLTTPVVSAGESNRFNLVLPESVNVDTIAVLVAGAPVSVDSVSSTVGWVEFQVPSAATAGVADVQVVDSRDGSVIGTTTVVVVPAGSAPSTATDQTTGAADAAGDSGAGSSPPPASGASANGSNHSGATRPLPPTLEELDPPIVKPKRRVRYTFPQFVLAGGVSVTIGGIPAPVLVSTSEFVEFRVPGNVPLGPTTIEIRTAAGDETVYRMQVVVEPVVASNGEAAP